MPAPKVSFNADGSCTLTTADGEEGGWVTVQQWASDWFAEYDAKQWGAAHQLMNEACDTATAGVVDALVVMADVAHSDPDRLASIGAGPLEDLVSKNGPHVLADVDRAARQNVAFRAALRSVWLGGDLPEPVQTRLAVLGATKFPKH